MSRDTTDGTKNFSIFFLNKHKKLLKDSWSTGNNIIWSRNGEETGRINYSTCTMLGDPCIKLSYKVRRYGEVEWRLIDQKITLENISCHFGGRRWYFRCKLLKNGVYCGRRVAVLYQAGDYFACRHCADLSYDSCNQGKKMYGFPWKILTNEWKANEIYKTIKITQYKGKPTRKYQRCLDLWSSGP